MLLLLEPQSPGLSYKEIIGIPDPWAVGKDSLGEGGERRRQPDGLGPRWRRPCPCAQNHLGAGTLLSGCLGWRPRGKSARLQQRGKGRGEEAGVAGLPGRSVRRCCPRRGAAHRRAQGAEESGFRAQVTQGAGDSGRGPGTGTLPVFTTAASTNEGGLCSLQKGRALLTEPRAQRPLASAELGTPADPRDGAKVRSATLFPELLGSSWSPHFLSLGHFLQEERAGLAPAVAATVLRAPLRCHPDSRSHR